MYQEHVEEMEEGLDKTELFDEDQDDAWEIEKDVHLDGEGEATRGQVDRIWRRETGRPEENGARKFITDRVGVYSGEGSGRCPAIVEKAKDINGMQSFAEREKE